MTRESSRRRLLTSAGDQLYDKPLITVTNVLPASVALVGLVVLMAWLFQDEVVAVG